MCAHYALAFRLSCVSVRAGPCVGLIGHAPAKCRPRTDQAPTTHQPQTGLAQVSTQATKHRSSSVTHVHVRSLCARVPPILCVCARRTMRRTNRPCADHGIDRALTEHRLHRPTGRQQHCDIEYSSYMRSHRAYPACARSTMRRTNRPCAHQMPTMASTER